MKELTTSVGLSRTELIILKNLLENRRDDYDEMLDVAQRKARDYRARLGYSVYGGGSAPEPPTVGEEERREMMRRDMEVSNLQIKRKATVKLLGRVMSAQHRLEDRQKAVERTMG